MNTLPLTTPNSDFEKLVFEMEEKTNYSVKEIKDFIHSYLRLNKGKGKQPAELILETKQLILFSHEADTQTTDAQESMAKGLRYTAYLDYVQEQMDATLEELNEEKERRQKEHSRKNPQPNPVGNRASRRKIARHGLGLPFEDED